MAITKPREDGLPLFLNADVEKEYNRWIRQVPEDPYSSSTTVGIHDVLRAHFLIVDFFVESPGLEPVGGVGPKDLGLLHSALGRQHVGFDGIEKWSDKFDKLATLFYGLVKNHAFHDSNKRTALLTVLHQLACLGRCSKVPKKEWEDLAVRIAEDSLDMYPGYRKVRRRDEPEIQFISKFLQAKTRKIERGHYIITYRQLDTILRRFGYYLTNPAGNHIDVVRNEMKRKKLFGPKEEAQIRVCQIGFPGWKTEVGRGAIQSVRRECRLTDLDGVDSQTFFKGVEPMHSLIAEYSDALRRLADR